MPFPIVTILPSGPIQGAVVGSPQVLICSVSTVDGVEPNSVIFNWIGPQGSYTNNSRIKIEMDEMDLQMRDNPLHHRRYNSTLQFPYLMEGDEGMYTCRVTILDTVKLEVANIKPLTSKEVIVFQN